MKILHINTFQSGGAALCAIRINKALVQEGVDSRMLFAEGKLMPEGVEGAIAKQDKNIWEEYRILRFIKYCMARLGWWIKDVERMKDRLEKANTGNLLLHQPLSEYKNIVQHPLVEWADIIHLHWVSDFVDYPSFFKEVKKPIIWTLHDHYPAGGVQHYYSKFSPIPSKLIDIDRMCRKIKRESVSKAQSLYLVAISEHMVGVCKDSDVLRGLPIIKIHNGVDTSTFCPNGKMSSRKELGLVAESKIFLFSSFEITYEIKGLDRVIDALEKINVPNKMLVCIGNIPFKYSVPEASFPIIVTGMVSNQTKLSKYYSAADFFIQASFDESFGQTVLESMSCGTPVITTLCGIAGELIHPFNGVICDGYDADAIAAGIRKAMKKEYDPFTIRQYIFHNFQYDIIAKQYIDLYKSIFNK